MLSPEFRKASVEYVERPGRGAVVADRRPVRLVPPERPLHLELIST